MELGARVMEEVATELKLVLSWVLLVGLMRLMRAWNISQITCFVND